MTDSQYKEDYEEIVGLLNELWLSETAYVEDLQTIINLYLIPFRLQKPAIIKSSDIPKIFCNIEKIAALHQDLLEKEDIIYDNEIILLENSLSKLKEICKLFSQVMPLMPPVYSVYSINLETATEILNHYNKNTAFLQYEDKTRKNIRSKSGLVRLEGLISAPFQRVCKYPLFFQGILKKLKNLQQNSDPEQAEEFEQYKRIVEETYLLVEITIQEINHEKFQKEKIGEIIKTVNLSSLKGIKIENNTKQRVFLKHFPGKLITPATQKAVNQKFWLFSDLLFWGDDSNKLAAKSYFHLQPSKVTVSEQTIQLPKESYKVIVLAAISNPTLKESKKTKKNKDATAVMISISYTPQFTEIFELLNEICQGQFSVRGSILSPRKTGETGNPESPQTPRNPESPQTPRSPASSSEPTTPRSIPALSPLRLSGDSPLGTSPNQFSKISPTKKEDTDKKLLFNVETSHRVRGHVVSKPQEDSRE